VRNVPASERAAVDKALYHSLLSVVLTSVDRLGYRTAAKATGMTPRQARRYWEMGLPSEGLQPLRDVARAGRDEQARTMATAAMGNPEVTQAVEDAAVQFAESVHRAGVEAVGQAVADRMGEAAAAIADAQAKLYSSAAKAIEEEGSFVDNSRRTALNLLGRLIQAIKAAGPALDKMNAKIAEMGEGEVSIKEGIALLQRLVGLSREVVEVGDKAMALRRRLSGDPERWLGVKHDGEVEMSTEDAQRELREVAALLAQADTLGHLTVIEGGKSKASGE
jgi:hypothetical protein